MDKYLYIFHLITPYGDKIAIIVADSMFSARHIMVANNIIPDTDDYEYKIKVSSKEKSGLRKLIEIDNDSYLG